MGPTLTSLPCVLSSYEKLLRIYDPHISLCYWDTTLEPDVITWSALWSPELFGNMDGLVKTGFARNWITPLGSLIRDGKKRTRENLDFRFDFFSNIDIYYNYF